MHRGALVIVAWTSIIAGCGGASPPSQTPAAPTAEAPQSCPAEEPILQSPARFGSDGVEPEPGPACDTLGADWQPCHQHMHCGPEHSGAGICGGADCEVHTVYRRSKTGGETAAVAALHEGTVGGNCDPANHHLLVRATFLDFADDCAAGPGSNLTYCGSPTGNNSLDADHDGKVTCTESGINAVPVRWCIQTACECHPGSSPEAQAEAFGEREATREQGCPNPGP